MASKGRFGDRKSGTWSQEDWKTHKLLEVHLDAALAVAVQLDPTLDVKMPYHTMFTIPGEIRQRGTYLMNYAIELNNIYLMVLRVFTRNGWVVSIERLTNGAYRCLLQFEDKKFINSYSRSLTSAHTWVIQNVAINTALPC